MKSSLREEIASYIDSCIDIGRGELIESPETIADNLIAKIEKRIDKEIKKYPTLENFSKLGGKSSDDYRVEALTELKKEMLK